MSPSTSQFDFVCEGKKFKNLVAGVSWIGRHFTIESKAG